MMNYLTSPFVPLSFLLLLSIAFTVHKLNKSSYSAMEKQVLAHNYHQNLALANNYQNLGERCLRELQYKMRDSEYNNKFPCLESYAEIEEKMKKLSTSYHKIKKAYFDDVKRQIKTTEDDFRPILSNPNVIEPIKKYIESTSQIDEGLAKNYENFSFENGVSEQEFKDLYFDTDDYLKVFHFTRFEAQFTKMYYEDMRYLEEKIAVYPLKVTAEQVRVIPYMFYREEKSFIEPMAIFPVKEVKLFVGNTNKEKQAINNFENHQGSISIPKEFRTGDKVLHIAIPTLCAIDTTFSQYIDFHSEQNPFNSHEK